MPKAKRQKLVSLTKTVKRSTKEHKQELIDEIRESVDKYQNLYVFDVSNVRSKHMKEVRKELDGRIYMSRNKVMQVALGREKEDEIQPQLHKVSAHLKNQCGLLFTDKTAAEVQALFDSMKKPDFAKAGSVATRDIVIPAGPMENMPFSLEQHLVSLNCPVEVKDRVINFRYEHKVCAEGDVLKPEQAKILKLFNIPMSMFEISLKCQWSNGKYSKVTAKTAKASAKAAATTTTTTTPATEMEWTTPVKKRRVRTKKTPKNDDAMVDADN